MRKPWNRPELAVYSLVSRKGDGYNMNICTYVTAVSMQPKRYIIGVYKNTCTLDNLRTDPEFVLQLMAAEDYRKVVLLGKQSGFTTDKLKRLKAKTGDFCGFPYILTSCAILHCKVIDWMDAGDHIAALCDVITYRNLNNSPILTTTLLREKKIIRA